MLARLLSSRRLWAVLASLLIAALVGGMAVSSADVGALLGYGYGGGDYGGGAPVTDYPFGGAVEDLAGCADHVLPANDDRSTAAVPLPFALDFLGDTYSSVYVNNNGNLTFRAPEPTYEPHDLAVGGVPMIAPFLADVDTRPAGSGVVTYGSTTVDGRPAFCVNWLRVGYFARHVDRRDSFQALLVASGSNGDFDIVFNYDEVAWEAGDASGGVDGLGGLAATAGWTSGDGVAGHHELLPGSATAGGLLDSNPSTGLIHGSRDSAQLGRYVFPVRNVPVETAAPAISGTAVQGQVLGVAHGTWTNDPTSYGYRWQRCDALGASCEPIDGATSPTYTLGDDDVGHTVVVEETATNAGGDSLPAASAPTAVVVALPPVEVAPPTVSGTAQEGRTLTEHHGSWTNRPVSFTYQWKRCAVGGGDCVAIAGATDDAYTATASDVGSVLVVEETAHNTGGASAPAASSATAAVLPAPPSPVSPPTISGVAIRGRQLSVEHGAWTNDPTSYGHQWQRCDALGAACQPIAGATGDAYTATASDVGHALRVQETAANAGGSSQPQTSAPTAIVVPSAPVNVSPPTITGIPRRGQTLTEHHGDWTDAPTGFTYRWERCDPGGGCVAIAGAVTAAYTLTASDVGHAIVVEETARNAQGTSDPATSEPTGTVSEAIARVTVTAQGGAPLSGASVVYVAADGTATSATTDGDGVASLSGLPDGDDTVYAWLSGYRPKVASVSVSGGSGDATVSLDPGDVGVATLVSHQLTPQEIEDAGIDTSDPDNQLVYGFDITLDYTGDPSLPHELCGNLNGAGQFVGGTAFGACGGGGGGGGASGCAGTSCHGSGGLVAVGTTIQGHPLIELLHLSGHATVLKQLFSVDMTVANLSGEPFDLTGGSATLSLPAGLSLAPTATPQSETQDVATVPGGGAVTTSWIVRGDVPGSYGLTAGYHGRLQPFDADVDIAATLADPLRVWGADALRLRVQADSGPLVAGRPYHVRVGLTNDADVPFYNVALGLDPDGAGSDSSGAARFIYQPGERFDDVVGEIDPGETVYSHTYVLVPDGASTGALDPATSSALFAGQAVSGDPVVEAMTPPPLYQLTAPTDTEGEVHLHWQQVPGAEGYEVFSIPDLDTPFDAAPEEVQGGDDSYGTVLGPGVSDAYLPAAAGARYYAVSTIVDGRPTLEHAVIVGQPGTSAPGGGTSGAGGGEAPAGGGPVDDGRGAPAPGCPDHARTLLNGAVTIEATCFTEASPGVLSATGRIRVNGLDLETSGAFRIDLGKLTLSADGAIDAYAGSLHLYHGELRLWSLKAHLTLPALPKLRIKGLPVTGNVDVGLVPHGAEAKLGASIGNPSTPFAVTGQVTLRLTLASGLQLDSLDLALDSDIPIATLVVKRASLSYRSTRAGDVWTGKVSAQLPSGPDVSGSLSVTGGAVSEVGITVSKLNKPIGAIVFLQSLGLDVTLKPRLSATGSVGLTAGPKILNGSAAAIDGSLSLRLTSPVMLTASGDLKVVDLHVASASLQAAIPGSVAFSGDVHKDFPGFGVDANLGGTVSTKSFEAKGGFALNVPGASGTGDALVNEHGVAACATAETALLHQRFTIGAAYRWGQGPRLLDGSCGFGELRDTIAHAAQRGVPVTTIPVPRAHRQLNVVAHGAGRPPALRLSLGSARATVRPGSAGRLGTTAYVAVADEAHDDTVVIIASPPAGHVVVTAAPGSSPILGVRTSIELPDPRVRVRVAALHDGRYRLSWTSRRISGQRLTLWLRAGRASRLLLHDASRSSGHVDFAALPGSTVQHVRVVVSQDGLPRKIIESAATLHARRVVLHAPKVTLRRHGSKATIAWTAVHGAARYVVTVRTSDGRRLFYSRSARSRSLTVHSTGRLTASVRGEDAGLRDGPARSVTSGG